ncbi:MAG TPA: PAS domain-containing protein, partial [Gemmatimonadaceae bacterium]
MPQTGTAKPTGSLAILSEIASRLAEGGEIVVTVGDVIERLQRALGAIEVSLWLYASTGLRRSALAGTPILSIDDIRAVVERGAPQDGVVAQRLVAMGQRVGVLAVAGATLMTADAAHVLAIVANLLAPELAHAEDVHRLTGDLARSAQQIETERRLTTRIIDALPLGMYVIDRSYRVQAWNSSREMGSQGVSREAAMGKLIFDVLHRQPAEVLRAQFDEVFETGRVQQFTMDSD